MDEHGVETETGEQKMIGYGLFPRWSPRKDVDRIVNACDAGREGELIFAYVYDTAKAKKPVQRLWLSSMTRKAIGEAFGHLRDGGFSYDMAHHAIDDEGDPREIPDVLHDPDEEK